MIKHHWQFLSTVVAWTYSIVSLCVPLPSASKTIIHILRCYGHVPYSSVMSPLISIFYCILFLYSKWVWLIMHGYMNVHKAFCSFTVFDILLQSSVHLSCVWKCIVIVCFVLKWTFLYHKYHFIHHDYLLPQFVGFLLCLQYLSAPIHWMSAHVAGPSECAL